MTAMPYYGLLLTLPLRFQILNGDTILTSAVHLLPMIVGIALGSLLLVVAMPRLPIPIIPAQATTVVLICLPTAILATAPLAWNAGYYVAAAIAGLAIGPSLGLATAFAQIYALEKHTKHVGTFSTTRSFFFGADPVVNARAFN